MKRIRMEVCPQSRGERPWKVTRNGDRVAQVHSQREGIELARRLIEIGLAEGNTYTLKIKRPTGEIRDERTYPRSSDPRRSKG